MYGWGHGLWGWLAMLLFWGGLVLLIVYAIRSPSVDRSRREDQPSTGRRVLDERLARGEISVDEYRERREVLEAPG
ncbi:MAG: SHOCT domain-containing protein [Actinobacteria bacterium]|nr:SHOCT domain-containing protein [Actinomycetota bacterium]